MKYWTKQNENSTELFELVTGERTTALVGFMEHQGTYKQEENFMKPDGFFGYKIHPDGIMLISSSDFEDVTKNGYIPSESDNFFDTHTLAKVEFGLSKRNSY